MTNQIKLHYSDEVATAIKANKPIVALESTIISHGLPYPENLETAHALEDAIRSKNAVPATIAVMDGIPKAGLSHDELARLSNPQIDTLKLSRRDLPFAISKKIDGATTVATTMMIAAAAGIKVFATGGIGGVHRGADQNFDISADLTELGQTDVAVVCAGPKAILDIPATMEYLETLGVPVIGYQCDAMPLFWSRASDLALECRLDSAREIADLCQCKWDNGLAGGVLIANPIPKDVEISGDIIEAAIDHALHQAASQNISGKALTPFLLDSIRHITDGHSLKANKALVENNAILAAEIAAEMVSATVFK